MVEYKCNDIRWHLTAGYPAPPAGKREVLFYWPRLFVQPSCFVNEGISTGVNSERAIPYFAVIYRKQLEDYLSSPLK